MPTLLSDTFTDTDGTALASHTMDVGGGWTNSKGTHKIVSNKATPNSGADDDMAVADAGQANVIIDVDVTPRNATVNEYDPDLILRYSDTTHLWVLHITSAGSGVMALYENTGVGYVLRATSTPGFISGTTYAIRVTVSGNAIYADANGTNYIAYTSASGNNTATKFGLRTGNIGSTTLCTWDNYLVRWPDLAAAGTSTVAMVGGAVGAGAMSSAGTSTVGMVGASTAAGVLASAGVATVSFVGTAITGDGEVFTASGTSSVSMVGASTAAAAMSAAGTSTVAMVGVGLVTIAGDFSGAGTCSIAWVGQRLLSPPSFYRPGRTDEGQGYRGRADASDDGRRGRTDESQEYRGRADEPTS